MRTMRRIRSACASAQSDQDIHYAHFSTVNDAKFLHADSEDSDQTARMCMLIRAFVGAHITKAYLYNSDPLKPHFYIVKLGFTGVYIIFLISA